MEGDHGFGAKYDELWSLPIEELPVKVASYGSGTLLGDAGGAILRARLSISEAERAVTAARQAASEARQAAAAASRAAATILQVSEKLGRMQSRVVMANAALLALILLWAVVVA